MAPATAQKPKAETARKERARFEAPLASGGRPLVLTMQRMREYIKENGVKEADTSSGRYINFISDGFGGQFFQTEDPDEIAFLRERENAGTFSEVPIPKPSSSDVLKQIVGLTARGDTDALVELARVEEETHQREDVLEAISDALEQIVA